METVLMPIAEVEQKILLIRGQKVILDSSLAAIYGVGTKRLNEQVRRNADRFPADFVFQLTPREVADLRSQPIDRQGNEVNRSQFATASSGHRDPRFLPYAFTEHGAIMAATVLKSPRAVQMSVFVVRAFVRMRKELLSHVELEKRLVEIEKSLMLHDTALRDIYVKMRPLLLPLPDPARRQIGFGVKESRARCMANRTTKRGRR